MKNCWEGVEIGGQSARKIRTTQSNRRRPRRGTAGCWTRAASRWFETTSPQLGVGRAPVARSLRDRISDALTSRRLRASPCHLAGRSLRHPACASRSVKASLRHPGCARLSTPARLARACPSRTRIPREVPGASRRGRRAVGLVAVSGRSSAFSQPQALAGQPQSLWALPQTRPTPRVTRFRRNRATTDSTTRSSSVIPSSDQSPTRAIPPHQSPPARAGGTVGRWADAASGHPPGPHRQQSHTRLRRPCGCRVDCSMDGAGNGGPEGGSRWPRAESGV